MSKHEYSGYISFGFWVDADKPLTQQEIIEKIADNLTDSGIPKCDLGDIDHYIDGELQEKTWQE